MSKKIAPNGLLSPTQLWGKPLSSAMSQKTGLKTAAGKKTDEEDVTDDDEIDVDAELAEAEASDGELHAVEAEIESEEVAEEVEAGDDEESDTDEDEEPDYDAEEGDVSGEAENETEEDEEEEVVATVAASEENGEEESPTTTRNSSMPEKMSLSDHIRAEIARRQKAGESPIRGKDIVEALSKKKIKVSPAQVSQLMKKAGVGGKARGKRAATPVAAGDVGEKTRAALKGKKLESATGPKAGAKVAEKAKPAANGFKVPMVQLQAAEAFVDACGGSFKDAERILTAAAQLSQTFGN